MSKYLKGAAEKAVNAYVKSVQAGKGFAEAESAAKSALSGAIVEVDRRWAKLATPLSQVALEEIQNPADRKIDLIDAASSHKANVLGLTWNFAATAGVGVEIDVLDAKQAEALNINPEEKRSVVGYALAGDLGASAAGGSTSVWKVGATVSAGISGRVEWYVAASSNTRLGDAFLAALPLMVAPMDLPALVAAAQHPDFWGCDTRIEGSLQAGFTAKASWTGTGGSLSLDGSAASVGLSLGVSGQATFAMSGLFRLRCIPVNRAGVYKLHVRLEQLNTREKSLGLQLSLGADFSAVTKAAESFLRSRTPEPNDELLNILTQPATAIIDSIQEELGKLLRDSDLKGLVPMIDGSGSKDLVIATLAEEIAAPLADKLDLLSGEVASKASAIDALVDELVSRLFGSTPVAAVARQKVADFVKAAAGRTVDKLEEEIKKLGKALGGLSESAAADLLRPLAALGEQVADAVEVFGANLTNTQAVKAIREGLERYAKLRRQVLSVLGDAQRAKVVLTAGMALQEASSQQIIFEGDFGLANDMLPAQRLYAALWRGDLREFTHLRRLAEASGSLSNVSGWLELTAKRTVTESVTLSAFGFEFQNTAVRTSNLVLRSDLSGNLLAVVGNADAAATTTNPWVERMAKLGISVRLSSAGTPEASAAMEFAGAFSARGKNLDEKLFKELQRSVASLSGQAGPVDLARLVGTTQEFDKNFWRGAAFVLPMSLNEGEMVRLVDADPTAGQLTLLRWASDAMDRALGGSNVFSFDSVPSVVLKALAKDVIGSSDEASRLRYLELYPRGYASWKSLAEGSESYGYGTIPSSGALPTSESARQMVEFYRLSRSVRAFADFLVACKGLRNELALASSSSSDVVFDRCRQHLRFASDAMSMFAVSSTTLVGNDEPVSWRLVAFAGAISELARGEDGPRFIPLVTLADRPNRPIPLIA